MSQAPKPLSDCCVKGFQWDGEPSGRDIPFPTSSNQAYVTGSNPSVAILYINDAFGWRFKNNRLLADHFAREVDATVYVPDFFDNKSLPDELLADSHTYLNKHGPGILMEFGEQNNRALREPEIFACARHLRSQYTKLGAIGYCFGGWANLRIGAAEFNTGDNNLVDCISIGHPSWVTKQDMDEVAVPTQILAPQHDPIFSDEMKSYAFEVLAKGSVPFEYRHFPGVAHACLTRGDPKISGEREAMDAGKNLAVRWMKEWLHPAV